MTSRAGAAARAAGVVAALAAASGAAAETPERARAGIEHVDAVHRFRLVLPGSTRGPGSFGRVSAAEGPAAARGEPDQGSAAATTSVVAAYRDRGTGAVAVVTRMDHPNPEAWRARTREAYFDEVERGIREGTAGYRRLDRRAGTAGIVPVLDLRFRHERGGAREVVHMRLLFFRRYTLALALAADPRGHRRLGARARAIADSFQPYFAG